MPCNIITTKPTPELKITKKANFPTSSHTASKHIKCHSLVKGGRGVTRDWVLWSPENFHNSYTILLRGKEEEFFPF